MHIFLKFSDPLKVIHEELNIAKIKIASVISLIKEGNTIPFIARYRKEATGNLDEVEIRKIQEKFTYLEELDARKEVILNSIESQGKLTPELKETIIHCDIKNVLEDLYLPFKPKRRTRATIAKEKGLEPLAMKIVELSTGNPHEEASKFIDIEKGISSIEEALQGAQDIVAEMVSENATIRGIVREIFLEKGMIISKVRDEYKEKTTKYNDYYDFKENVSTIPSHRYLAIRRGEKEEILTLSIDIPEDETLLKMQNALKIHKQSLYQVYYVKAIEDALKRLIKNSVETEIRLDLKVKSDESAVEIFAQNLKNLLLSAPIGEKSVIGIDPGLRTGCKCAVVNSTGKFLETATFNLVKGEQELVKAKEILVQLIKKYHPYAIAVGNGTAGRETEALIKKLLNEEHLKEIILISVSESGASVYSASEVAREEFPDLDLTIRGAISIARRLQDPLAELVKVDPKAIGVGQYQHDIYQPLLQQKLKDVVESCVNYVGVELNTASAELLSYVSGIGSSLAKKIVNIRDKLGKFVNRNQLQEIPGLGSKTFQQAAGFLRIREGDHPLDASAVHPESYSIVERMAKDLGISLKELIGNLNKIELINIENYISEQTGKETIEDIIEELKKPGRDPRSIFSPPQYRDDINTISDLQIGMRLEGVVTNVAAFGAFVDIGVHQDGLVHISDLSDNFVKDPHEIVKVGDKIKVTVLNVDIERKRISLSAKNKMVQVKSKKKSNPKVTKKFYDSPFAFL